MTKEDKEILLQALRAWGALDADYKYVKGRSLFDPARTGDR